MKIGIIAILIVLAVSSAANGGQNTENPVEVGDVHWGRDFDASLRKSAEEGKPVLVLFQEIPGCSGVRKFGREVLTNPVLVRAIENEFIPMLVYNNRSSGIDRKDKNLLFAGLSMSNRRLCVNVVVNTGYCAG